MNEGTAAYLQKRTGEYYRETDLTLPPNASHREWGRDDWDGTQHRQISLQEIDTPAEYFAHHTPKHAYVSAAKYDNPSAPAADSRGYRGADLVITLDAETVCSDDLSHTDRVDELRTVTQSALALLTDRYGFEDTMVVYSGWEAFDIYVRDDGVQSLDARAREELAEALGAVRFDLSALSADGGSDGRAVSPIHVERLVGGWYTDIHSDLMELVNDVSSDSSDEVIERVTSYDGVGDAKGAAAQESIQNHTSALRLGNFATTEKFPSFVNQLSKSTLTDAGVSADADQAADPFVMCRLPGSLNGGSALVATRVDDLSTFDATADAVPCRFTGETVDITTKKARTLQLNGEVHSITTGTNTVPEYVALHLFARGDAEKA